MDTGAATFMSATLEMDATSIRAVLADPLLYPPSHVPSACTSSTSSELPAPPQSCQQHGCAAPPGWGSVFCDEHLQKCAAANCKRVAVRGGSVCRAHGGARMCAALGCTKIAQGSTPHCKSHGGGKQCQHPGCVKAARDRTLFCKAHGGGKRCAHAAGCVRSAEGTTAFCVAHGGGRRCQEPACTKSAIGATQRCIKHGGGKRCQVAECHKSAQVGGASWRSRFRRCWDLKSSRSSK
mmetsp:Transcript_6929/g.12971  ORF Transcript_6929/g.12971 Transcript_6929/m.12971 type:complete len:237 (-) Transcript_6929:1452-2162(-)